MSLGEIEKRTFGTTGQKVTAAGLGGEGILRTFGQREGSQAVIQEAVHQGISYFDCARVYAGSEGYYGSVWARSGGEFRSSVFQASKSAMRDRAGALFDLDTSLSTMSLSYLDLWQIHDVRDAGDLRALSGPGGGLRTFLEAKHSGKTRLIGVTGHHDPYVLTRAVEDFPVDSVMLPVNPLEGVLGGFLDGTLPAARKKGLAVVGMKVLGAGHYVVQEEGITAELLIRYALSWDIDVAIVGCSTPEEVKALAGAGRDFTPLTPIEMGHLEEFFRPHAKKLAYYRGVI